MTSLGYDQAGPLQHILLHLDSPRAHLVSCGLHNRQGTTLGVLVLLHHDEEAGEDDPDMQHPARVAFVEAVSGVAALCIDSQRLLEQQKKAL